MLKLQPMCGEAYQILVGQNIIKYSAPAEIGKVIFSRAADRFKHDRKS
jgi:hypothetical protein